MDVCGEKAWTRRRLSLAPILVTSVTLSLSLDLRFLWVSSLDSLLLAPLVCALVNGQCLPLRFAKQEAGWLLWYAYRSTANVLPLRLVKQEESHRLYRTPKAYTLSNHLQSKSGQKRETRSVTWRYTVRDLGDYQMSQLNRLDLAPPINLLPRSHRAWKYLEIWESTFVTIWSYVCSCLPATYTNHCLQI